MSSAPQVIVEYNRHMGSVDKLDIGMSLYPIRAKTKKWPVRVISHLTSFVLANSWLQYVWDASAEGLQHKETKNMLEFRTDVALSLIHSNRPAEKKKGRPSLESLQKVLKPVHNAAPLPTMFVPFDGKEHWPQHVSFANSQRCRKQDCKSKTHVRCMKSVVFLRLSATNYCFFNFHQK
ncbi:hypothetical protein MRX96_005811 [Rhipicephalus microplus]